MSTVRREEVEAALEARRELGKAYEDDIVDGLVEKIEQRLAERPAPKPEQHVTVTPLALGSIGAGVGATAIAAGNGEPWLAVIAWIAIALVNLGYAFRR